MRSALLAARSVILWILTIAHFIPATLLVMLVTVFVPPRRNDTAQRIYCRTILRLAGVRFRIRYAKGFDPRRTVIVASNHVNIFDAYVVYSSVPQYVRGIELASHFKIPFYGWMARRHGNIAVPDRRGPGQLRALARGIRGALTQGDSVLVFPEGHRTRTGRLGEFEKGIFRMAADFGYPIAPLSIVGSYEFHRTGDWMLRPSTIVVYLHDLIETSGISREEADGLADRVRRVIAGPVEAAREPQDYRTVRSHAEIVPE